MNKVLSPLGLRLFYFLFGILIGTSISLFVVYTFVVSPLLAVSL